MKLKMTLEDIQRNYLGDQVVRLQFCGASSTAYKNQLFLKVTESEAEGMTLGQEFLLTPVDGAK